MALDVLEGQAAALVLEGDADIVDAALLDDSGATTRAVQAKTKIEPHTWGPQEIAEVLARWVAASPSTGAHFDFVTDGSLGPTVSNKLRPALRRTGEGAATVEDREYLTGLDLDPNEPVLGRVALHSRMPDGRTLLERETLRVLELRERNDPLSVEQARDVVWRLFGEAVLGSSEVELGHRRLERDRIAELVGVPVALIDDAEPWSEELDVRYREALGASRPDPAWTLLDLLAAERPPALSFVTPQGSSEPGADQPRPATVLLDRSDDVLLQGPAGAGKTTTLAQLRVEALDRGLFPLYLRVGTYIAGDLMQILRRSLELATGRPLAPGVVSMLLDRAGTVVFLDGAGELVPEQREAVIADMEHLRKKHPRARLMLAAREAAPFGRSGLSGFVLQGLNEKTRREIASTLAPDGDQFVDDIEDRLGDVADNPLLFTMAVGLYARGTKASSRAELFDGFMQGLQRREEGVVLSAPTRAACEAAAFELRSEGRYSADRWWWLDQLSSSRAELIERGTLSSNTPAGEDLRSELEGLGLLQSISDSGDLAMLHDLFCDWLASEAVRHGLRELPDTVPEQLEDATVFLAERGELNDAQLLAVAGNAIAAARVADALLDGRLDPELTNTIWRRLCDQLAPVLRAPLEDLRVHVVDEEQSWIYLAPPDMPDPLQFAPESPVICLALATVSSLSAAVDLWLAVVRLAVGDVEPGLPARPVRHEDDLADRLEAAVLRRASAVESMVNGLAPPLSHRILRTIGPSGLRGWLLPVQQSPGLPGSGQTIEDHTLRYITTADGTHIERVLSPEEIPGVETTGTMSADSYIRRSPQTAAQNSITDALAELIPRYGD